MSNNLSKLLFSVLKGYGVPITQSTLRNTILTHPYYPSMQCISDALDAWKVKHVVMELSIEKLHSLKCPAITHLKKSEFIGVTRIIDSKVHYRNVDGKKKVENIEHFKKEWSGVALFIESVDGAGEANFKAERKKELKEKIFNRLFAASFAALFFVLTFFSWRNDIRLSILPKLLLILMTGVGCAVSYLLIRQEKRQSDALSRKFCKIGKFIDCKQVTQSKYSKLFGFVSLAEIGLAYFNSMLIWVAIAPLSVGWLSPLCWFSFITLPFTLWSMITQAFFIRKWCLFCCCIVLLMWANATVLFFLYPQSSILSIPDAAMAALLFMTCLGAVMGISKTIGAKAQLYSQQRETAKIKYDFPVIQTQLTEVKYTIDNAGFTFGNTESSHEIGLYISTKCSHCGTAIKELHRLTGIYPDFSYRLIFAVYSDDSEDQMNLIIRYMYNLYKSMYRNDFFTMLYAWYSMSDKTIEVLQEAYPVSFVQDCTAEINAFYQFGRQFKISYTPALLLDGRLISRLYSFSDLYGITRSLYGEE